MSLLSSQRHYAFDLDGTIFDTRPLVEKAYAEVGVQLPETAWGRTWQEWLVPHCGGDHAYAALLHGHKAVVYDQLLHDADLELSSAGQLLVELVAAGDLSVTIMTGASVGAASRLVQMIGAPVHVLPGMRVRDKAMRLLRLRLGGLRGVAYVDDDLAALEDIRASNTGARLVEFNGQGLDELRREVLDGWTP